MVFSLFICLLLLVPAISTAQGLPLVPNYDTAEAYSPQNWALAQDSSGYLYVSNSAGLLQFDGAEWRFVHIRNDNIVSSLYTASDGTLLVGGLGEFGYLQPDSLNRMKYRSLSAELKQPAPEFSYVWDIVEYQGQQYFYTEEALFVRNEDELTVLDWEPTIGNIERVSGSLFVWLDDKGLHYLEGESLTFIRDSERFADDRAYAILPFGKEILLCFRKADLVLFDGRTLTPFKSPASEFTKRHKVYKAIPINESEYAIATLKGGIIIVDRRGNIIERISVDQGLPTDVVYNLYLDREKALWAALDDGISRIAINSPVRKYDERSGLEGIVTTINRLAETTYVGTTQGFFAIRGNQTLEKQPAITGRVYDTVVDGSRLMLAASGGIYALTQEKTHPVNGQVVTDLSRDLLQPGLFCGVYGSRLYRFEQAGSSLKQQRAAEFDSPVVALEEWKGDLWLLTRSGGAIRTAKSGDPITEYQLNIGNRANVYFMKALHGNLWVGSGEGLFRYRDIGNRFARVERFHDRDLNRAQVFSMGGCSRREDWFRADRRVKHAVKRDSEWRISENPYQLIGAHSAIHAIYCGEQSLWFGGSSEVYHLPRTRWDHDYPFRTNIIRIEVIRDSLIFGGFGRQAVSSVLPYDEITCAYGMPPPVLRIPNRIVTRCTLPVTTRTGASGPTKR